jgi:hypothetical protein
MKIPTLSESSVDTTAIGAPRQSMNNPAIDALGNVGKTLQGISGEVYDYKAQADKTKTKGYAANYNKEVVDLMNGDVKAVGDPSSSDYKIESGFLRTEGDSAMHSVPQGLEALKKLRQKYIDGIEDSNQKKMFSQVTEGDEATYDKDLQRHQFQQIKALDEKNHTSYVSGLQIKAGLHYRDMSPGGQFESDISEIEKVEHDHLKGKINPIIMVDGKAQANPTYADAIREATAPSYKAAIEKLSLENVPEAKKQLEHLDASGKINLNISESLWKELTPKLEAYKVEGIVSQVSQDFPKDVNDPFDRAKYDAKVDDLTTDPNLRKKAKADIKQREGDRQDSIVKRYGALKGTIQKNLAIPYWDKHQEAPWGPIEKSAEYGQLTATEQADLFKQVDAENWKLRSHRETISTQLKVAATAERTERRRIEADKHKAVLEDQHANANRLLADPETLAQMDNEELAAENLTPGDHKYFTAMKKKLTTPDALHEASVNSGSVKTILSKMPGLSEEEKKTYGMTAQKFIDAESKLLKRGLHPKEVEDTVIAAMQHVSKTEATSIFEKATGKGKTKQVDKRVADVVKPADYVELVEQAKAKGITLSPEQIGRILEKKMNAEVK